MNYLSRMLRDFTLGSTLALTLLGPGCTNPTPKTEKDKVVYVGEDFEERWNDYTRALDELNALKDEHVISEPHYNAKLAAIEEEHEAPVLRRSLPVYVKGLRTTKSRYLESFDKKVGQYVEQAEEYGVTLPEETPAAPTSQPADSSGSTDPPAPADNQGQGNQSANPNEQPTRDLGGWLHEPAAGEVESLRRSNEELRTLLEENTSTIQSLQSDYDSLRQTNTRLDEQESRTRQEKEALEARVRELEADQSNSKKN